MPPNKRDCSSRRISGEEPITPCVLGEGEYKKKELLALQSGDGQAGRCLQVTSEHHHGWSWTPYENTTNSDDVSYSDDSSYDANEESSSSSMSTSLLDEESSSMSTSSEEAGTGTEEEGKEEDSEGEDSEGEENAPQMARQECHSLLNDLSNKIVSFNDLQREIEGNLVCKHCVESGVPVADCGIRVRQETFGLATEIRAACIVGHNFPLCTPNEIISPNNERQRGLKNYTINSSAILATQICGIGLKGLGTFSGLLGLRPSLGGVRSWRKVEALVGQAEQGVASKCLSDNLDKEIKKNTCGRSGC